MVLSQPIRNQTTFINLPSHSLVQTGGCTLQTLSLNSRETVLFTLEKATTEGPAFIFLLRSEYIRVMTSIDYYF